MMRSSLAIFVVLAVLLVAFLVGLEYWGPGEEDALKQSADMYVLSKHNGLSSFLM